MSQLTLRDAVTAATLKEQGLNAVEANGLAFVTLMRKYAIEISDRSGFVTSDNLRVIGQEQGIEPHHPNVYGAIFRGTCWKSIGRQRSAWPSNHHRFITVWRYEP